MILPRQNWDDFNSRIGNEGGTSVPLSGGSSSEKGMYKMWFEPLGIFCEKLPNGEPGHGTKQKLVFACRHCTQQDPSNPSGIVWTKYNFFLCGDCNRLYEAHRFEVGRELITTCYACVWAEWQRIFKIDPSKCRDFSTRSM